MGGMSGSVSTRTANRQAERVTASGQLRLPACWAALPAKSRISRSPASTARRRSSRSPSGASSTSRGAERCRRAAPPGRRGCGARCSRAPRRWPRAAGPRRGAGELGQALRAGAVGGELGAQVGTALGRLAHARHELLDRPLVERPRGDHDALLLERAAVGGHRARARGRPRRRDARGWRRSRAARLAVEDGRDDGDVGQVGAAGERVVEDPGDPGGVLCVEHRGDRGGHRAEVHGDVLGLHDHLAVGVEQRGGGVAALLDVRGVRRADQHRRPSPRRRRAGRR